LYYNVVNRILIRNVAVVELYMVRSNKN